MASDSIGLSSLPVELLAEITHRVTRASDLLSLCVVSPLFNELAERELYSHVSITKYPNARRFQLALRARPERQKLVRAARLHSIHSRHGQSAYWTSCMLCPNLEHLVNLETIELASNFCQHSNLDPLENDKYDELIYFQHDLYGMFRHSSLNNPPTERPLPNLSTLRLHFESVMRPGEWDLGPDLLHIFLSPTLRDVTLDTCNFLFQDSVVLDNMQYHRFSRATPLETLRLINCLPGAGVLGKIFSLPRGLRHFSLEPYLGSRPLVDGLAMFKDLDAWTDVFIQQKHALEDLVLLAFDSVFHDSTGCLDLRSMEKVKFLAGDVFQSDMPYAKQPTGAKQINNSAYYLLLRSTRPDWYKWTITTTDPELNRSSFGELYNEEQLRYLFEFDDVDFEDELDLEYDLDFENEMDFYDDMGFDTIF